MHGVFWILVILLIYTYFGYPLILSLVSRLRRKRPEAPVFLPEELPAVSLLIAARNEEKVIAAKIENSLALDYPREKLEIMVVSDGSTDGTDAIAERYRDRGIRLLRVEGGKGKTTARNAAVEKSSGEIIVFSDSNAMYEKEAVRRLVGHFGNRSVGAVCGNLMLVGEDHRENIYWKYEKWIKSLEDRAHSIIGANGSIYAIRKGLYRPLPPGTDDDFIEPLLCYMKGHKLRYEPKAVSVEKDIPKDSFVDEYIAKKRVVQRGIQSLARIGKCLNPLRYPALSFQLFSHKVLKWLMPFVMIGLFIDNMIIIHSVFYEITFVLQVVFLLSALIGIIFETRLFRIPAYFILTNAAVFSAVVSYLSGKRTTVWQASAR